MSLFGFRVFGAYRVYKGYMGISQKRAPRGPNNYLDHGGSAGEKRFVPKYLIGAC